MENKQPAGLQTCVMLDLKFITISSSYLLTFISCNTLPPSVGTTGFSVEGNIVLFLLHFIYVAALVSSLQIGIWKAYEEFHFLQYCFCLKYFLDFCAFIVNRTAEEWTGNGDESKRLTCSRRPQGGIEPTCCSKDTKSVQGVPTLPTKLNYG